MSLIAYEAVWDLKLQPSEKLIMLCLAEHHNKDTEQCNPAYKTIADETGLSKQHVIRLIAKLESDGVITIFNQTGRGSGNSNNYQISILKGNTVLPLPEQKVTQKVTSEQEKVTSEQEKGNTVLPEPIREPFKPLEPFSPNGETQKPRGQKPLPIPAVKIFVEVTGKYCLNKTQMQTVGVKVGTDPPMLEKWRKVVEAWMLRGYKITNVEGMLDWLANGIPQKNGAANGTHKLSNQQAASKPRKIVDLATKREYWVDGYGKEVPAPVS